MELNPYFINNIVNLNTSCFICTDNVDTNPKNLPAVNGVCCGFVQKLETSLDIFLAIFFPTASAYFKEHFKYCVID